jgi:hypothetical protein
VGWFARCLRSDGAKLSTNEYPTTNSPPPTTEPVYLRGNVAALRDPPASLSKTLSVRCQWWRSASALVVQVTGASYPDRQVSIRRLTCPLPSNTQ